MNRRLFFILVLLITSGSAQAGSPLDFWGGNPIEWLTSIQGVINGSGAAGSLKDLAYAVAMSGFMIKMYAAVGRGDVTEMRGVVVQGIGVALMLSACPLVTASLAGAWTSTYSSANQKFGANIDQKLGDAGQAMGQLVQNVGDVAIVAGSVGAVGGVRALASNAAEKYAASGGKSAATKVLSNVGSKIMSTVVAMNGFIAAYSSIIAISGFIILVIALVAPLAASLTMWGQTGPLWSCVGSGLGALLIAMLMPVIAFAAIDKAFVQPAKIAEQYSIDLSAVGAANVAATASTNSAVSSDVSAQIEACSKAATSDTISEDCLDPNNSSILEKAFNAVTDGLNSGLNALFSLATDFIKSLTSAIIQIVMSIIYFVVAMVFMVSASQFVVSVLGSAASFAGSKLKG